MANTAKTSALVAAVTAKHPKTGAKLAALQALHEKVASGADDGGPRDLTPAERKVQTANALTGAEHQKVIDVDYGEFVAVEDIYHEGALTYKVGHPVPISLVELHGYDESGSVERKAPKAAKADTPKATGE